MLRFGQIEIDFAELESWPTILPVLLAFAGLTVWAYSVERRLVKPLAGLLLVGLRLSLLSVLACFLLGLRIRWLSDETESLRRSVVVAVDTSWSMDLPDRQMDAVARLRTADALGTLPPGQRKARMDDLPELLRLWEGLLGDFTEDLRLLGEALRQDNARLSGRHPRAESAHTRLRLMLAVRGQLDARLGSLLAEGAGLPMAAREALSAGRDAALRRAIDVVGQAERLPLKHAEMMARQEAGDLGGLAKNYEDFLANAAAPELREKLRQLARAWQEAADRADEEFLRTGDAALSEKLETSAATTRRERVRGLLARDQQALLSRLEQRYRVRFLVFDRESVELDVPAGMERLKAPPAAPIKSDQLAALLERAAKTTSGPDPFNAAFTDYEPMLRTAGRGPPAATVAGIVVFTDGISNPPPDKRRSSGFGGLRTLAGRLGIPVVCVPAGYSPPPLSTEGPAGRDGRGPRDVRIVSLEYPRVAYRNSEAEVVVNFAAVNVPADTPLSIRLLEGNQPVPGASREVPAADVGRVTFRLDTKAKGQRSYTVEIRPVPDELIEINNRAGFSVAISDSKIRVLVLAEDPGWEWKFIRDTLERDRERIDVDSMVLTPGQLAGFDTPDASGLPKPWGTSQNRERVDFPATLEDLYKYDVIIVGDLDARGRFFKAENFLSNLVKYVRDRGGSLILSPGRNYLSTRSVLTPDQRREFESLLPVTLPSVDDERATLAASAIARRPFKVVPAEDGKQHLIARLAGEREDNAGLWRSLPENYWRLPTTDIKPGATVLLTVRPEDDSANLVSTAGSGTTPPPSDGPAATTETTTSDKREFERRNPILAHHRSGLGRVMTLGIQSTWRMRLKVGDPYHGRLWGQIVRWAAPSGYPVGNELVQMRSDKPSYRVGEPVQVEVRFLDRAGKPLDPANINPELVAYVGDPRNGVIAERVRLSHVPDSAGLWRAEFRNLRDGRFSLIPALGKSDILPEAGWRLPETGLNVEVGQAGDVAVLPPGAEAELVKLARDRSDPSDALNTLAAASGGLVLEPTVLEALPAVLEALEKPIDHLRRAPERPRDSLWSIDLSQDLDELLILVVFLTFIALEWIIRKWVGLI